MHCHQSLQHDPSHPLDLLFLELPLRPRIQYIVEVVGKILKCHDLPIRDDIDQLSKGAMTAEGSIKGVHFGIEEIVVVGLFENYRLLIIALTHQLSKGLGCPQPSIIPLSKPDVWAIISDQMKGFVGSFPPTATKNEIGLQERHSSHASDEESQELERKKKSDSARGFE